MKTICLELETLPEMLRSGGARVAIGIKKLGTPGWSPNCIGVISSECFSMQELENELNILIRDIEELRKQGRRFFENPIQLGQIQIIG